MAENAKIAKYYFSMFSTHSFCLSLWANNGTVPVCVAC